jgi:ABC-type multidrug transport system fused ATPase/permease subunit
MITIVFMVGLMFWLDWDFTLIALGVTPFLLVFIVHFERAVKDVTRSVRARQSEIVAVVQEGCIGASSQGVWPPGSGG